MELNGKTAIITGGASGLGEATIRYFAGQGANVVILDLNNERGEALASELGEGATYAETDVSNEESVSAAIKKAVDTFGTINIVVNCAGIGLPKTMLDRDGNRHGFDYFQKVIAINLTGSFNVLHQAAEVMLKNEPGEDGEKGVIINTASIAAYDGQIGQSAYSASKGGIVGMTIPIARELARHGIRINTIAPGLIHTPLFDSLPEKAVESLVETTQFPKRLGKPEEYAKLAEHIVTNTYLNGETIRMDAGVRMPPR